MCFGLSVCVLIPGRASSESELLGSSVGVPDVDTGKRQSEKKEGERERGRRNRERERERERDQER